MLQLAMMAFLRDRVPTLGVLEDLRLAVDEVLLHDAITRDVMVSLNVSHDDTSATVEVTIDHPDVNVVTAHLEPLVDRHSVQRTPTATHAVLHRRWSGNHAPAVQGL